MMDDDRDYYGEYPLIGGGCPYDMCDYEDDSDHEFCAKLFEHRAETYAAEIKKKEEDESDFLLDFGKKWRFWLYLNPDTMRGDIAPSTFDAKTWTRTIQRKLAKF